MHFVAIVSTLTDTMIINSAESLTVSSLWALLKGKNTQHRRANNFLIEVVTNVCCCALVHRQQQQQQQQKGRRRCLPFCLFIFNKLKKRPRGIDVWWWFHCRDFKFFSFLQQTLNVRNHGTVRTHATFYNRPPPPPRSTCTQLNCPFQRKKKTLFFIASASKDMSSPRCVHCVSVCVYNSNVRLRSFVVFFFFISLVCAFEPVHYPTARGRKRIFRFYWDCFVGPASLYSSFLFF